MNSRVDHCVQLWALFAQKGAETTITVTSLSTTPPVATGDRRKRQAGRLVACRWRF